MANVVERVVLHFGTPGMQNTRYVAQRIKERLQEGGIAAVVVASCSGSSTLELLRVLQGIAVRLVNVSAPRWAWEEYGWHAMTPAMAERLSALGVICCEAHGNSKTQLNAFPLKTRFYDPLSGQHHELEHLERVFYETLVDVGGMGLKTAIECVLTACASGHIACGEIVLSAAGSGWGLDTAVVARATTARHCFGEKPSERLEVREILAMPTEKQRWG